MPFLVSERLYRSKLTMTTRPSYEIGEPAPVGIHSRKRYVNPAIAIQKELEMLARRRKGDTLQQEPKVLTLARSDRLLDPVGAYEELQLGRMPRRAGLIRLTPGIVIGAIDLMALRIQPDIVEVLPQLKEAVDNRTKQICAAGVLTLSRVDTLTGQMRSIEAFAEAINPDVDTWRAMELGVDVRAKQNEHGLVVVPYDRLGAPLASRAPEVDLASGRTLFPRH